MMSANQRNARKSTGPGTEGGKQNFSRNAGQHRVFARVCAQSMKELGEDPKDFDALRRYLRGALGPRDGFEEMLVEEMAVNRFRLGRLHQAEVGTLALHKMKAEYTLRPTSLKSQANNDNFLVEPCGLAGVSELAEKYVQILNLLLAVRDKVAQEGFSTQGFELLQTVYGNSSPGVAGSGLLSLYKAELKEPAPEADPGDDAEREGSTPETAVEDGAAQEEPTSEAPTGDELEFTAPCAHFLDTLDGKIQGFTLLYKVMQRVRTTPLPEPVLDSLLLPPEEELDRIMRYETHLERQFQWKLQQ